MDSVDDHVTGCQSHHTMTAAKLVVDPEKTPVSDLNTHLFSWSMFTCQSSACMWPRTGMDPAANTLGDALEGPGPISSFRGKFIGSSRLSGGGIMSFLFCEYPKEPVCSVFLCGKNSCFQAVKTEKIFSFLKITRHHLCHVTCSTLTFVKFSGKSWEKLCESSR